MRNDFSHNMNIGEGGRGSNPHSFCKALDLQSNSEVTVTNCIRLI